MHARSGGAPESPESPDSPPPAEHPASATNNGTLLHIAIFIGPPLLASTATVTHLRSPPSSCRGRRRARHDARQLRWPSPFGWEPERTGGCPGDGADRRQL